MNQVQQMTASQLKDELDSGRPLTILDVRESWEWEIAHLPDSLHIPLNQIPPRLKELDASKAIIVLCHAGGRSQMVANFLITRGFGQVANLAGGIDAWSREVDADMPTY
jgi:adenylyltransferase/sulfurtransferase